MGFPKGVKRDFAGLEKRRIEAVRLVFEEGLSPRLTFACPAANPQTTWQISDAVDRFRHKARPSDLPPIVPARSTTEEQIAKIWGDVLGLDRPGADDILFELGGTSLAVMQIVNRIHSEFGVEVPIADFFDQPSVAGLAAVVDRLQQSHQLN